MIDVYREPLARVVAPLGRLVVATAAPPHAVSMSGVIFGCMSAYFFFTGQWALGVVFFAMEGLADAVDGMVARARNLQSPFGSFFDNFCSAYADSAVFAGLIAAGLCNPWWGIGALVGTLTRLLTWRLDGLVPNDEAEALRTRFPTALLGKGDRIVVVAIGAALGRIDLAIVVIALGTNLVAIHRCYHLYTLERAGRRAQPAKLLA
jgi:archaetidylinositol phosphate synthase